jgi:hypothetical protein
MDATKPYKFRGFGAMDATKPYKFIGFGAMDATKPYKFIGFGALDLVFLCFPDRSMVSRKIARAKPRGAARRTLGGEGGRGPETFDFRSIGPLTNPQEATPQDPLRSALRRGPFVRNRASGPEIVDVLGLHTPSYRKIHWKRCGTKPPTFSSGLCGGRGAV